MEEIDETQRASELTDAFIGEREVTLNGHTLRPFTGGSVALCRKLGLSIFLQTEDAETLDEDEVTRQLDSFFWLHSQPVEEVLDALDAGKAERAIAKFGLEHMGLHIYPQLMAKVNRLSKLAAAASVEIESKPEGDAGEKPVGKS